MYRAFIIHTLAELTAYGNVLAPDSIRSAGHSNLWPQPGSFEVISSPECVLSSSIKFKYTTANVEGEPTWFERQLVLSMGIFNAQLESLVQFKHLDASGCVVSQCQMKVGDTLGGLSNDTASESYSIEFDGSGSCSIWCGTVFGCMHGMPTFVQMVNPTNGFRVPQTFRISDKPRFSHRGLLIDTGRRFLPVSLIKTHLEIMASVKMNVLHWHVVDDHSFPLRLESAPLLSERGAYSPRAVYSRADVREIVEYADSLGIRVIPELDIPGHTAAWMKGYPELLGISKSAIDPTREANYDFLSKVLTEVVALFRSKVFEGKPVIHLGGDETWDGWDTPAMAAWMKSHGMTSKGDLARHWLGRISTVAKTVGFDIRMWEDFLEDTGEAWNPVGITWQAWKRNFRATDALAAKFNQPVLFSSDFYLDHLDSDWGKFYGVDMATDNPFVIGGEACMWGESVDASNHLQRVWPRAAAIAERLWCGERCPVDASLSASLRLAKWRCRMVELMGYSQIEPIGQTPVAEPDQEWFWHTDKEQWYCAESDLVKPSTVNGKDHTVVAYV